MRQHNGFRTATGIGVVVATPVLAATTWLIVTGAGSQGLLADAGDQLASIGLVQVAIVSTVTAILGMLSLAWLVRRLRRGQLMWGVAACCILLISFAGALAGVASHDRVGLMALHVVTGATVIAGGVLATRSVGPTTGAGERHRLEADAYGR
ncbi:MAG: DUF6069 family protein [Humibacillus sp.]|nr:DUF6069 family protein [Humibacillus sp.]MDN5779388.1 DUF6069 family protein [Humibacillus sp.]